MAARPPGYPVKHIILSWYKLLLILCAKSNIICLTREPNSWTHPSRPGFRVTLLQEKKSSVYPAKVRTLFFLCCLTSVITAQSMIIKVNKSPYVTMISASSLMRVGGRASCSAPLVNILYCQCSVKP